MSKLVNRAKMTTTTTGTGTITLGSASTGYQTFAAAGVSNGDVVRYVIEDGIDWEIGSGTYTSSGTTLSRAVEESSNADAAINLSGNAVVFVTAAALDIVQPTEAQTLTNKTLSAPVVTGDLTIADKIVHSGDTNTSIRFPAADTVTVETSGTERLRIDSSGNVGIGATPTTFGKFEVTQATNKRILTSTAAAYGGNAIVGINDVGAEVAFGIAGNPLIFSTNAAERMRLDASGNVGIGTSSPTQKLDVAGNAKLTGTITSTANSTAVLLGSGTGTSTRSDIQFSGTDGAGNVRRGNIGINVVGTAGNLEFYQNVAGLAATIDSAGNLGLGVTPSAWGSGYRALDINTYAALYGTTAAAAIAGNAYFNGTNWIYKTTAAGQLYVAGSGAHAWFTAPSGTAGNPITFTQAMTLDASGSLAIGATSSYSATSKLQVTTANIGVDAGAGGQGIMVITSDAFAADRGGAIGLGGKSQVGGNVVFGTIAGRSAGSGNAGYLQFATLDSGGTMTERMRIDSSGNVGIGTNSVTAGYKLEVVGNAYASNGVFSSKNGGNQVYLGAAGQMNFGAGGSDLIIGTTTAPIRFGSTSTNTEWMRIDASGNLGIGVSPSARLHAYNATGGTVARLQTGTTANGNFLDFQNAASARQGIVGFVDSTNLYIHNDAAAAIIFDTSNTERMRIDASGNLGLGVTPSAWGSGLSALELKNGSALFNAGGSAQTLLSANGFFNGTNWIYKNTAAASYYNQNAGGHAWLTAPSGTAGGTITFTQAMTLDASGNLLVGGTSALASNAGRGNITINGSTDAILSFGSAGSLTGYVFSTPSGMDVVSSGSTYVRFFTNSTERARIHASGGVSLGNTTDPGATNLSVTGSLSLGTDLAITEGGTGASDAATARTNLGLTIGTNVQAYDADLAAIAALAVTDGNFIVGNGTTWVAESGATARTSLGLGTLATQSGTFSGTSSGTNTGDQNIFQNIAVSGQTTIAADTTTDTLTVASGTGITLTTNATTDTLTITNSAPDQTVSLTQGGTVTVTGTYPSFTITGAATDLSYTASTRLLASSTGTDATLPLFTSTEAGLVPLSGGGTTNFLRADGTWASAGAGSTADPLRLSANSAAAPTYSFSTATDMGMYAPSTTQLGWSVGGTQRMSLSNQTAFSLISDTAFYPIVSFENTTAASGAGPIMRGQKKRGTGAVTSGDNCFLFGAQGFDGSTYYDVAGISFDVDAAVSSAVVPGRITFKTTNSSGVQRNRLRIDSTGAWGLGDTTDFGILGDVLVSGGPGAAPDWHGAEYWLAQNASYTLANSTASQKIFNASTNGALTLPVGTYEYEALLSVQTMSATSGNASFNIRGAGTATISSALSQAIGIDAAAGAGAAQGGSYWTGTTSTIAIVTAATATGLGVSIRGWFRVSVAGTIIPSIALQAAINTAAVQPNSYIVIKRRDASATATTFGPWA